MTRSVYKFRFCKQVTVKKLEDSLLLAVIAAKSLHGNSGLRLDASFCLDIRDRSFIVNAETQIGCDLARMFTGFLERAIGEDSFDVRLSSSRTTLRHGGRWCG